MTAPPRIDPDWPLLMLPGTLCDARVFAPMLAGVTRDVLHGDMTGLPSAEALARRLLSTAPARFIPVGFSLGAIVALELAVIAPERVRAMVLIAANGRHVPAADHAARRAAGASDPVAAVDSLWPRSVAARHLEDASLRNLIRDMARQAPQDTLAQQTEVALTRSDKRPLLPAMTMPALVLGGAQDQIAPPALQQELAAGLPHATLQIAQDAGHFLPLECPDFCARALAEWLAPAPAHP
ncbi:alpha/beta fold hydrolase [Novosphingobium terrae]|uniref:alpha/beta fold hydrolase n=1 Tax=Novosphingobium terrae TaxID=2726189 RepID=UPI0019802FCE|nr:alpha/beta hydrolase [Novosphingobium terrae]